MEIFPVPPIAQIIYWVFYIYFSFRWLLFSLMLMDMFARWVRRFEWFPKEGKRKKTVIHMLIALVLLVGFVSFGEKFELFDTNFSTAIDCSLFFCDY